MNRIKTSDVSDPSIQQPFTARSLDFLQDANKDMAKAYALSVIGKIYDTTKYYVISGLDSYGTHQYTEGYVFHDGEVYYCPGKSSTTLFSGVPVLTVDTTTTAGTPYDPVTFTDDIQRDVHLLRRFILSDGSSGSGTVDYFNCIFIDRPTTVVPVLKAFNASNTEIASGFTSGGFNRTRYVLRGNSLNITITGQSFVIGANARYLTIEMPLPIPTTSMFGTAVVAFQRLGTTVGFAGIAELNDGVITIRNIEINTDIPAMPSDGCLYLSITASIGS